METYTGLHENFSKQETKHRDKPGIIGFKKKTENKDRNIGRYID